MQSEEPKTSWLDEQKLGVWFPDNEFIRSEYRGKTVDVTVYTHDDGREEYIAGLKALNDVELAIAKVAYKDFIDEINGLADIDHDEIEECYHPPGSLDVHRHNTLVISTEPIEPVLGLKLPRKISRMFPEESDDEEEF